MEAKALICREDQSFEMSDVTLVEPGTRDLVVRTAFSGVSIGTEFALIRGRLSWGPYPICVGYQAVGVIEQVGAEAEGFAVGQKVYYRMQPNMTLPDGSVVTSACGLHCSHAVIPPNRTHGAAVLPEGVDDAAGSLFVMPAVGQWGVEMSDPHKEDVVVVHGVGLIGLGVVAACVLRGCVVVAVDLRDDRLAMAQRFGASRCLRGDDADLEAKVGQIAEGGADVVFECTGLAECITPASMLARTFGKFVYQATTAPLRSPGTSCPSTAGS